MLLANPRPNILTALLECIDLFSECQHETNIWEALYAFYHTALLNTAIVAN